MKHLVLAALLAARMPLLFPTHDVAVTYLVRGTLQAGGARQTLRVTARWNAALQRLRLSAPASRTGGYYLLVAFRSQHLFAVNPATGIAMQLPMAVPVRPGPFALPAGDRVRATGHETLLGRRCTDWRWRGRQGTGTACVTQDGIVLRAQGHGTGSGIAPDGTALAVGLSAAPLPAALFRLGPGLHRLDLTHIGLGRSRP